MQELLLIICVAKIRIQLKHNLQLDSKQLKTAYRNSKHFSDKAYVKVGMQSECRFFTAHNGICMQVCFLFIGSHHLCVVLFYFSKHFCAAHFQLTRHQLTTFWLSPWSVHPSIVLFYGPMNGRGHWTNKDLSDIIGLSTDSMEHQRKISNSFEVESSELSEVGLENKRTLAVQLKKNTAEPPVSGGKWQ